MHVLVLNLDKQNLSYRLLKLAAEIAILGKNRKAYAFEVEGF